jgi:hypothetical protein
MVATESVNKVLGTRLVQVFGGRLKDWADELQKRPGTLVAISRKAPRLIELMIREGFLPESVLSRVIAEQALPFLTQNDNAGFVVIDDAMTYGTTFKNIFKLTEKAQIRCDENSFKVTGIPFAVGQDANPEYRKLATKHFLDLTSEQIVPLVNNEMLAFRLLGKPYDIEHPMLTWTGDFTDVFKLEATLDRLTELLDGQKTEIDTLVPTSAGSVPIRRWTILLPTNSHQNFYPHADFAKLRVYLNPEKDRLLVAAMRPLSLSKADMDSLGEILPVPLNHLWNEAAGKIDPKADEEMAKAGNCSLAMWANFLLATVVLRDIKAAFLEAFEAEMLQPHMFGPRREDLQYLIGPDLCSQAETELAQFLESGDSAPVSYPLFDHSDEIINESFPSLHAKIYKEELSNQISKALDINDVLQAIFYTQHADIELKTREDNIDDDSKRLEFGITYSRLHQMVINRFPDTAEIDIHECLDKLIDNGAIVPKYLNMASSDKSAIWVRTFRVGEGSVKQVGQTVRLLFEKLSKALGGTNLPPLLFEKYCAMALCVAGDFRALQPLKSLKISKLFHLYGARPGTLLGKKQEFLTEWAVSNGILNHSKGSTGTEASGSYSLHQNINLSYPSRDCPWDKDVKEGLEDLAKLVVAIHTKHTDSELVALTSTASNQELHHALEAELKLWLYDYTASVYHGLDELSLLAEKMTTGAPLTDTQLESVNNVLYKTANFTAQVTKKIEMAEKRQDIYNKIYELAATDTLMSRCWDKIHTTLEERISAESISHGLMKIRSALRIAHVTTRILRELLSLAGYIDDRSKGLEESLNVLQAVLKDLKSVDPVTMALFAATDLKPDIIEHITVVKSQPLNDFKNAFPVVRELVLEIADRCEQVLQMYGTEQHNEPYIVMPLRYIIMWDIKGSSEEEDRSPLEAKITEANQRIRTSLKPKTWDFNANSKDDGNMLICEKFATVLDAFNILTDVFCDYCFRVGCEVNLMGQLNLYPQSNSYGGKAFEYAARVRDFYKEAPTRWSGKPVLSEPKTGYMVVSEFAKRYAQQEKTWPTSKTHKINDLDGTYKPKTNGSLPMSLTILEPIAIKPKGVENIELQGKQQELL